MLGLLKLRTALISYAIIMVLTLFFNLAFCAFTYQLATFFTMWWHLPQVYGRMANLVLFSLVSQYDGVLPHILADLHNSILGINAIFVLKASTTLLIDHLFHHDMNVTY